MQIKMKELIAEVEVLIQDTLSDIGRMKSSDDELPEDILQLELEVAELRRVEGTLRVMEANSPNVNILR